MKTNQNLIRKMGDFDVIQRTSDGMFNATALLRQWNHSKNDKKEVTKFFENQNTRAFVNALITEENLNTQNSAYLKTRGKNGGTWMHPILFVKFSMWLNPTFEVKVIKFVYDELIKYRNEAGDAYKEMAGAVAKISEPSNVPQSIQKVAKAVNYIVYNMHETEIRNKQADEIRVRELWELERDISKLIKDGFIKSFDELIKYLRRKWQEKYVPKELVA
jgi:hypothetical protein